MKAKKIIPTATDDQSKTSELESRVSALESRLARALADYQNLERRFERESSTVIKFANSSLLERLLEIRDNLASATAHLKDASLAMILSSLDKILGEEGVVEVDCSGQFDPSVMECQDIVEGDKDQVMAVVRPGYKLHDRLLRAARVNVGKGSLESGSSNSKSKLE